MKALTVEQFISLTTSGKFETVELTFGFCKKVAKKLKEDYGISSKLTFDDFYDFHCKYPNIVDVGSHVTIHVNQNFLKEIKESVKEMTVQEKNYVREVFDKTN